MIVSTQSNKSEYSALLNLIARLPIQERLRLISEVSARLSLEVTSEKNRTGLKELYGVWRGAVFSEEDFKAAEWSPSEDL